MQLLLPVAELRLALIALVPLVLALILLIVVLGGVAIALIGRVRTLLILLPLLVVIMVSQTFARNLSNGLWSATILLVALDSSLLVFRLRRELGRRFPDQSTKGAVGYGMLRSIQLRFIRLPKPQVKLGTKLADRRY